jgi:hypothetical protein
MTTRESIRCSFPPGWTSSVHALSAPVRSERGAELPRATDSVVLQQVAFILGFASYALDGKIFLMPPYLVLVRPHFLSRSFLR